jgi:hypothetical protein
MEEPTPPSDGSQTRIESAVLLHALIHHPAALTVPRLIEELCAADAGGTQPDAVKPAIHGLCDDGLLQHHGDVVTPSRAAIRAYELWSA